MSSCSLYTSCFKSAQLRRNQEANQLWSLFCDYLTSEHRVLLFEILEQNSSKFQVLDRGLNDLFVHEYAVKFYVLYLLELNRFKSELQNKRRYFVQRLRDEIATIYTTPSKYVCRHTARHFVYDTLSLAYVNNVKAI